MEAYFQFLSNAIAYDAAVYTNWVMYVPLLIPIIFYTIFFYFKWLVLLMPIWAPFMCLIKLCGPRKVIVYRDKKNE